MSGVISSSQGPLPDNTQNSHQTDIHAPGGIRTHILSCKQDRPICLYLYKICCLKGNKSKYSRQWNSPTHFLNAVKFVVTMNAVNKFSFRIARSVPEALSLRQREMARNCFCIQKFDYP